MYGIGHKRLGGVCVGWVCMCVGVCVHPGFKRYSFVSVDAVIFKLGAN